jgi:hypothetical protein
VVKVEGMGQEEAAVVAVAVRGGAGNDLPQFSFWSRRPWRRYAATWPLSWAPIKSGCTPFRRVPSRHGPPPD